MTELLIAPSRHRGYVSSSEVMFLFGIVNILSHKIPSLMPFTLTDDPQFYGSEMSLSNILMIGLFRSNSQQDGNFSKTGKKFISQQTRKESYICDVNMKGGGAQDVRGPKIGYFCGCHKCMTPKWFKITTNSIIRGSSSKLNHKPDAF